MPLRTCTVSFLDARRVRHAVEVAADSLMEAAVLGLKLLQSWDWSDRPGRATQLEIQVKNPER